MKTDTLNLISKFLRYTLLAGAILYVAVYLILVYFRIQYPFELNWIEGSLLNHVMRVLSGQKLYVMPSFEFTANTYAPLYFYLSAAVSSIIGVGFIPLRLVSFISSLGCFFIIFRIVQRETGSKFSGVLASCLFAATFEKSGGYFDVARIDSLFLFFLLTALYLVKFATSNRSYILAGIFISLSFLTKQTALIISLPLTLYCIYCIYLKQRSAFLFIVTTIVIIGGSTLILNYLHDGWYNYYLFDLLNQNPLKTNVIYWGKRYFGFWTKDMLPVFIAIIMSIFYIVTKFSDSNKKNFLFYFLIAIGMLGSSWLSRLHIGGSTNVLMPAYAVISILFGMAFHAFFEIIKSVPANKANLLKNIIYFACIVQFVLLMYNPLRQIPSKNDLEAGRKLVDTMAQIKGDIYVPHHTYLPALVGKKIYPHISPMYTVIKFGHDEQLRNKLLNEISQAIREKRFGAIILDSLSGEFISQEFPIDIETYYEKKGPVFDNISVFITINGRRTRPQLIYVPKKQ